MFQSDIHINDLISNFSLELSESEIEKYLLAIHKAQSKYPIASQQALAIKLISEWKHATRKNTVMVDSTICPVEKGPCITFFGILSEDWPGLSNTCLGVLHEMGWNVCFINGFSIEMDEQILGLVIMGVSTDDPNQQEKLTAQMGVILNKLRSAAKGIGGKANLLSEEMRKLEIFSRVISEIQTQCHDENLEGIIGLDGEAVKYFAARSRDYIENRQTKDIARQIIMNYRFIKEAQKGGEIIRMDICNFTTKREGTFTGVTVAGPSSILNLEDCLKTIELTLPNFHLKHNREFTTKDGIALFRIEFVDADGNPLNDLAQKRLKRAFSTLVLDKKRNRAQWIESIGGFEQYARAVIPLLVREAQNTGITQVYQSVGHTTDLYIDFKIIVVIPGEDQSFKNSFNKSINLLEDVSGLHILAVKPPKKYGASQLFIVDIRASLAVIDDVEMIYRAIRNKIKEAVGDFRDFDEGMRTMDTYKFKTVREQFKHIDNVLLKELYYSIEDFFRISANHNEIVSHISIAYDMIRILETKKKGIHHITRQTGIFSKSGELIPKATLFCLAFPHELSLLQKILEMLETYEVTLSRIERYGYDILICRLTINDKALTEEELAGLQQKLDVINKE